MATRKRRRSKSPWWATWLGAIGLGFASFVLVQVGFIPAALFAVLSATDASGTDMTVESLSNTPRVLSALLALSFLVLPVLTVYFARKKWLGWLLVALGASFLVMCFGLVQLGVL